MKGMMTGVKDKVTGAMASAPEQAWTRLDRAIPSGAASAAATAATGAASMTAGAAVSSSKQAASFVRDARTRFDDVKVQMADFLRLWIKQRVFNQIEKRIDKLPEVAKDLVEDPDMPRCISRGKDTAIDLLWPDARAEIMWELAVMIDGKKTDVIDDTRPGKDCVRAFLRYHLLPYNKSFWGKVRDPVYIITTLVSLIPISGVCQIFYMLMFFLIDKKDEYQLLSFILMFKGTQFISHGILRTIIGYFQFLSCVSAAGRSDHSCAEDGPGTAGSVYVILFTYVVQVVMVWLAFLLLPYSEDKGRSQLRSLAYEHGQGENRSSLRQNGGWMLRLMILDIVVFGLIFAVLIVVIIRRGKLDDWTVEHALFSCQVVYGYMSMPFFIFTVPYIQIILTHSVPTGYDEKGRCQKFIGPPKPETPKQKKTREALLNSLPSDMEMGQLVDKLKDLYTGMATSAVAVAAQGVMTESTPIVLGPTPVATPAATTMGARE